LRCGFAHRTRLRSGRAASARERSRLLGLYGSLEPPRRLAFSDLGYWNVASNCRATAWSWETFSGTGAWFVPRCGEEERTPAGDEACTEWPLLPLVPLGEPFRRQGWHKTDLGDCALVLGASGAAISPEGTASGLAGPGSAVLRVLALDSRTLVVELADDAIVAGARLVLTYSDWSRPEYGQHCYESAAPSPGRAEVRFLGKTRRRRERAGPRSSARPSPAGCACWSSSPPLRRCSRSSSSSPTAPRRSAGSPRPRSGRRRR
ncbi:MAG: hypothetical protein JW751_14575, partial [Polyangiaceae bacterium]|nr:hypothetical protein [Polyangiaceae bacterium]